MPTYLLTKDVLNVPVSCFANYDTPTNPKTINLFTWLTSGKHRHKINALRLVESKAQRDAIKATLPAITPSGVFTYRKESGIIAGSHTRLIQFDIDLKDNPNIRNYGDLKAQISKLPFVAYCALSASGKGYWGLVPIAYPERHSQHFDALRRVFAYYGIKIDTKPRNVASLRGYSYDPAPSIPEQVQLFELYDQPTPPIVKPFDMTTDADTERNRVEVCIQEALRWETYVGDSYADWYAIGCGLANAFGESGRDYYHHISRHYPGYQSSATDKQFTACLKARSEATLGTFFHLCKLIGIEWKELIPLSERSEQEPVGRQSGKPIVTTIAEQLARPGSILKPYEAQIERLTVEPCDNYPIEWDKPNTPDAKPNISAKTFHGWQQQHEYFGQMGLPSLHIQVETPI